MNSRLQNACLEDTVNQATTKVEKQMVQFSQKQPERVKNMLLEGKIQELQDLLKQQRAINAEDRNMRLRLSKELEETEKQLDHQKRLKERFINKEKETRNELERLKGLSDAATMNTLRIATEVRNGIKKKQKKVLQKEFEELKVEYIISQQRFSAELQAATDQNKALQQEVTQLKGSQQINLRYENEPKAERGKSDSLKKRLEKENTRHDLTTVEPLEEIKDTEEELEEKNSACKNF